MENNQNTKEKICAFYAGDYHFEMISLPYINQKLENQNEIVILTENDLEKTIKVLVSKINLKESKKEKILNINWKNEDELKIKQIEKNIKQGKKLTIFIKGDEKYIKNLNNTIKNLIQENNNIKIVDCYEMQEVGEDLEKIMLQYNKILSTSGEKEIEKL